MIKKLLLSAVILAGIVAVDYFVAGYIYHAARDQTVVGKIHDARTFQEGRPQPLPD